MEVASEHSVWQCSCRLQSWHPLGLHKHEESDNGRGGRESRQGAPYELPAAFMERVAVPEC